MSQNTFDLHWSVAWREFNGQFRWDDGAIGPSGSGKTTLLRVSLQDLSIRQVKSCLQGRDVSRLHARERKVGSSCFQHYALFRQHDGIWKYCLYLSVLPRRERPNKAAIDKKSRNY